MTTPDDALIHEDTALVAVLTEQVGTLNTLVTRFRLRANAAEARAAAAEAEVESLQDAFARLPRVTTADVRAAREPAIVIPAPASEPVGKGDIAVSLDAPGALAADLLDFDELLGEVHLR